MPKKTFLILLISMVCCLSAKAQRDTLVYYMKNDGISDLPIDSKDSADFYRLILSPDTSFDKNLFVVNDYYKNGKPKMISMSASKNYYVLLQGVCREFFQNGRRKSVTNYVNNEPVGIVTQYFPNGKIYLIGKYGDNNKLFVNECRDSTGKVLAVDGDGHYIKYSEDFKNVIQEGWISNGVEDGEWHGRLNDTIKYVCTYNMGFFKSGISYNSRGNEYPFTDKKVEPKFPGGIEAFYKFLKENIHYPKIAKENNVQGSVFLSFVVNKDGSLIDITIVRALGSGCDQEAVRVLKSSPKWIPGYLYGIPVRIKYTMPLTFALNRSH